MASLKNLIPENVMAAMIEETLRKSLVYGDCVNTKYQGVIASAGDSVLIPVIGDVTISDHTVNDTITYEALDSASVKLVIDQQKRFSFMVDDVDNRQTLVDAGVAYADRAAYQLKDTSDQFIAGLYGSAGVTSSLGTTAVPLSITAAATATSYTGVYDCISLINKALDNKNVPQEGRWMVVPPWFMQKMVLASIVNLNTVNADAFANGRLGRVCGFDMRVSTNVYNGSAETASKILAGNVNAISFASQILSTETLRLETKYGTGFRGLYVYGAKVVQPDELACATCSYAAG